MEQLFTGVGIIMGATLSIAFLVALVRVSMFAGDLRTAVNTTSGTLKEFVKKMDETLAAYDDRMRDTESKVNFLWDGHERRIGAAERRELDTYHPR